MANSEWQALDNDSWLCMHAFILTLIFFCGDLASTGCGVFAWYNDVRHEGINILLQLDSIIFSLI